MPRSSPISFLPMDLLVACNDLSDDYCPKDWRSLGEDELWEDLVTRILSTQTKWETAQVVANAMEAAGLLAGLRVDVGLRESELSSFLARHRPSIRWPARKASQIWEASRRLYHACPGMTLHALLRFAETPAAARLTLVEAIPGIGMKQASHFLQSIGFAPTMAVLDRHIERFMEQRKRQVKRSIAYEDREADFQALAAQHDVPAPVLDFAIWNLMRT